MLFLSLVNNLFHERHLVYRPTHTLFFFLQKKKTVFGSIHRSCDLRLSPLVIWSRVPSFQLVRHAHPFDHDELCFGRPFFTNVIFLLIPLGLVGEEDGDLQAIFAP